MMSKFFESKDRFYLNNDKPNDWDVRLFIATFFKYNSDKSNFHNYETIYAALHKDRGLVKNVMEMGVFFGASMYAWRDLYPNANIIGLEYDETKLFTDRQIMSLYADQRDLESLDVIAKAFKSVPFELIVDDGSHLLQETKNTFFALLPLLNVNGWFVVEDIKEEFENDWREIGKELDDKYESYLINMMDEAKGYNDNIVFAVKRLS